MKPYLIILYFIACITVGATADGLATDLGHDLEAVEILLCLSGALIFKPEKWWAYLISYVSFRIVGFDIIHNLVAGQAWDYIGSVGIWDKFFGHYPPSGLIWLRGIFLALGVSITTRYLKPVNNKLASKAYSLK